MKIVVVSEDEMKKLRDARERHELEELRASVRIASLTDAEERFAIIEKLCADTLKACEEDYLQVDADDLDDFEIAQTRAEKTEKIERLHARQIAIWENQIRRLNWEARQAQQ